MHRIYTAPNRINGIGSISGMRHPDFVILGAPKCGTTALYSYLSHHPKVFLPTLKEPNYFSTDMPKIRNITEPQEYSHLFAPAASDQVCGEASTSYLQSAEAVTNILDGNPETKLVAMVRNPIDQVPAFHQQQLNGFFDDEPNFEVAWHQSDKRSRGELAPTECREPLRVAYKEVGRLGSQVQRLVSIAPKEQIHIVVFDDFAADPRAAYSATLRFLGLPQHRMNEFPVVKGRYRHRFPLVSKFLMRPPGPIGAIKNSLKKAFPRHMRSVGDTVRQLTDQPVRRTPISIDLRREMAREFGEDIALLGDLLGRDLSLWVTDAVGSA